MEINKNLTAVIFALAVLFSAGCATSNTETKTASVKYSNIVSGTAGQAIPVAVKDFDVKGVIFVNSQVTYDLESGDKNGSEITFTQLMQEAVNMGADDIINVRIDKTEVKEAEDYYNTMLLSDKETYAGRKVLEKKIIYRATALAIKYTNAVLYPAGTAFNKPQENQAVSITSAVQTPQQESVQQQAAAPSAAVTSFPAKKTAKKKSVKSKPHSVLFGE